MIDIIKNIFKRKSTKKNDDCDIYDDLQIEIISDFIQNMEADLRYTIANLAEEVEDLKDEIESMKKASDPVKEDLHNLIANLAEESAQPCRRRNR